LVAEVEAKRSDARFRRDPNLVEHSVQGSICPFRPRSSLLSLLLHWDGDHRTVRINRSLSRLTDLLTW
jgi:hypothetical protein